jgi:hypothetical protein
MIILDCKPLPHYLHVINIFSTTTEAFFGQKIKLCSTVEEDKNGVHLWFSARSRAKEYKEYADTTTDANVFSDFLHAKGYTFCKFSLEKE